MLRKINFFRITIFLLLFILFIVSNNKLQAQYFDQTIYLPSKVNIDLKVAVEDMACWLQLSTGKLYKIESGKNSNGSLGIYIQLSKISNLPGHIKAELDKNGQSFYLNIKGTSSVQIVGNSEAALINGIYTFLHELGFRWYMPGDAWTMVPKLKGFKKKYK